MKLVLAAAVLNIVVVAGCEGSQKPAESPVVANSATTTAPAAPSESAPAPSASSAAPATSASSPAPTAEASAGVEKTVEMKWELVADTMCQPKEKHVRLRYSDALSRYEEVCSTRLGEELTKKKPKTIRATFLVYASTKSTSLCDIEGFFKGTRLPKGGCNFPTGWDQGAGASGIEGKDVPHPLFK